MATSQSMVNDRREIFGWAMYDWANSAFSTTVGTVFLGPYVASLAATAAEAYPDGLARFLGLPVAADSVVPFGVAFSVVFQAGFLPILGAIADYSHRRKQMLQLFKVSGVCGVFVVAALKVGDDALEPSLRVGGRRPDVREVASELRTVRTV